MVKMGTRYVGRNYYTLVHPGYSASRGSGGIVVTNHLYSSRVEYLIIVGASVVTISIWSGRSRVGVVVLVDKE